MEVHEANTAKNLKYRPTVVRLGPWCTSLGASGGERFILLIKTYIIYITN